MDEPNNPHRYHRSDSDNSDKFKNYFVHCGCALLFILPFIHVFSSHVVVYLLLLLEQVGAPEQIVEIIPTGQDRI